MGRNNATFTLIINEYRETWNKFRRGLRKEDQELFDEMWRAPKLHLAAGAFRAGEVPFETIVMSMLLHHYTMLRRLEEAFAARGRVLPPLAPLAPLAGAEPPAAASAGACPDSPDSPYSEEEPGPS